MTEDKPTLSIPIDSYRKMMAYTDLCQGEVTWFFDVEYIQDNHTFMVGEVYLLEQEAGGADVEMDEETISKFLEQMIERGVTQLPRGWGHSHVNMGTFFSGTDEQTITELTNNTFIVALVVNKRREMKCDIKINTPYFKFRINDISVKILVEYVEIPAELQQEVEAKVKTHAYKGNSGSWEKVGEGHWRLKNKTKGTIFYLPKDKDKALLRISALDLVRTWDNDLDKFVFTDVEKGDIYIDTWEVVTYADYSAATGRTNQALIPLPKRCINCNYTENAHNNNVCQAEIYDEETGGKHDS